MKKLVCWRLAISFEWDSRKEKTNRAKHGVGFAEACTVFEDRLAKIFSDSEHSALETRENTKAEKKDYEEAG